LSRLAYFTRETLISLRRNLLMTFAGVMTVAVSLFLFGGILLVSRTVDHGTNKWKHGVELEIFMQVKASTTQIDAVKAQLLANPKIKKDGIRFLSHQDAYNEFKRLFSEQPTLVENESPEELPTSFRVKPISPAYTSEIGNEFQNVPGVDQINTPAKQVKTLLNVTKWIRWAFFGLAGVLLASSLFLIVNTIRLATFARRREIEVMKLVGASNWFVRVPFMAEGFVQGTIGAGFAVGLVYFLKWLITRLLENQNKLLQPFYTSSHDVFVIGALVLLIGAGIGVLGSMIGLRRFLEV
jgi:cell division transport system permease protein